MNDCVISLMKLLTKAKEQVKAMKRLPEEKANPCGSSKTDLCGPSHRSWTCGELLRTPDHS